MTFEEDVFGGAIITNNLPSSCEEFSDRLSNVVNACITERKKIIWLTLDTKSAHLTGVATQNGFLFHSCHETTVTLTKKLTADAYAPYSPTHSIGGGGLVINNRNEILVIKERVTNKKGYKLPGGLLEKGEPLNKGIVREVYEETGIHSEFNGIVGLVNVHPSQFGHSNIYAVCRLTPLTFDINIQDKQEIEDAKWVAISDYLTDESHSPLNRKLVETSVQSHCLYSRPFDPSISKSNISEVFFGFNGL